MKASNSFEDVLSTDVGSSDHEANAFGAAVWPAGSTHWQAPVSKSDKKERLRSGTGLRRQEKHAPHSFALAEQPGSLTKVRKAQQLARPSGPRAAESTRSMLAF